MPQQRDDTASGGFNRRTLTASQGGEQASAGGDSGKVSAPSISLPKGGGAIRGIGEKFAANPVTGTGSMTVPIATSPGRSGFGPQLSLAYDSGAGNGPFGFGWSLSLPAITRKTDKGLPKYDDANESDVFILSGAEDLVPVLKKEVNGEWQRETLPPRKVDGKTYQIQLYRPRIEGLFARIERWTNQTHPQDTFWRSISKDNITTWYGKDENSRIADPSDHNRIFSWLICESHDDKGNVIVYRYKAEDSIKVGLSQAHEHNRTSEVRSANRYLKYIRYGNHEPYYPELAPDRTWPAPTGAIAVDGSTDWFFEVVFDYGEHNADNPTPNDANEWLCRHDPFSSYRAGFEVRTYRLCQRVLMFHHFPNEDGVRKDCLVRSTDFVYRDIRENPDDRKKGHPISSFIASVTQSGYKRKALGGGYLKKSLPPLEFGYTEAKICEDVHEIDDGSLENLPYGVDGSSYQWVDLDGEGMSGILTEQADGWFYKRNLSPKPLLLDDGTEQIAARFGPIELVATKPALALAGNAQFLDLAGDGQVDLVQMDGPVRGFYERNDEAAWESFRPFESWPNIDTHDPNLRFVDLDGDGHSDILITENEVFTWYPSLAEKGFGLAQRVGNPLDEEKGPKLIFADGTQSIYLADLSGDGMTDLVRIRNGDICYWPNLGYGHFGAKVTMDNAPLFDYPDQFNQQRIRLADIDGSGTTDIIYLSRDRIDIYRNEAGNRWSDPESLTNYPRVDNLSAVMAVDLLGNGTACLVWSSPLPGEARRPMRYIDLMGAQKPHLLVSTKNNLGAETHVHYAPSTKFYLNDKASGKPWITRLPFPVHVVERVETKDFISKNHFVTRYAYHHGYFDGVEREFRGFGMVEQWDTEEYDVLSKSAEISAGDNINAASHVPPVLTKTWFHTGVYLGRDRVSNFFAGLVDAQDKGEYYREPDWRDDDIEARKRLIDDTVLPTDLTGEPIDLTVEEEREACRALKGAMLRQEIYALDEPGTDDYPNGHPYTITEQNFTIKCLQPQASNHHAVFFTHAREAISYHYERNPADPRVGHALTLEVDAYGNVLKSAAIGYGRRQDDPDLPSEKDREKQTQRLVTYTENRVTNAIETADDYRTPLPCEARTYELTGYTPADAAVRFQISDFVRPDLEDVKRLTHIFDSEIRYEEQPTNAKQRRLIEHVRTLYRKNDLTGPLPLGEMQSLALPFESYKLAFTPGLLSSVYKRDNNGIEEILLPDPVSILKTEGQYLRSNDYKAKGLFPASDPDGYWWIPSGQIFYSSDKNVAELTYAREHFFLLGRFQDPFQQITTVLYDRYDLLMFETRDPLDNRVTVGERKPNGDIDQNKQGNDYRVLQPKLVMDPNRNRAAVAFDALGMVVGTAVMGKPEENLGDSLDDFECDLIQSQVDGFYEAADPHVPAVPLLKNATTRIIYDLDRFKRTQRADINDPATWLPVYAATLAREIHVSDPLPAGGLKIQISFSYSDGFGREIQKKIQAEPEKINGVAGPPRWVGSGWTIFNNKGKPVRQYEPFFSQLPPEKGHHFEFGMKVGVSSILFYDPLERVVATLHPNHTYEKVVFDTWRQVTWDVNDTVTLDPRNDEDVRGFLLNSDGTTRLRETEYLPTWYDLRIDDAKALQEWPDTDAHGRPWPDNAKRRIAEKNAAEKAAKHANTPTVAHFDTLGRPFLTITDNGAAGKYATRIELDIEGNQRSVTDARNLQVMAYDYDMLGTRIHQNSMDAGEKWTLNDVAGKPIRAWDTPPNPSHPGHTFRMEYDALRRPVHSFVKGAIAVQPDKEILFERVVYGENQTDNDVRHNLRSKVYQMYDAAGMVTNADYDFKGNLLGGSRQLVQEYRETIDWNVTSTPDGETFTTITEYDALNRPTRIFTPHNANIPASIVRPEYNEANLLNQVEVNLRNEQENGEPEWTSFVTNIDYNAKGQREKIEYGNGVKTTYGYDPLTFRLVHLLTKRETIRFPNDCPEPPPDGWLGCQVQNLHYTYDPVGNITHIRDDAQQTIFFDNLRVEPSNDYIYDAIYRLIEATGREHLGQTNGAPNPPRRIDHDDSFFKSPHHPGDGKAMGRYRQKYEYDEVGNILAMRHRGTDPQHPAWKRCYQYAVDSNRLLSTGDPDDPHNPDSRCPTHYDAKPIYSEKYDYDAHGNMTYMPHLNEMMWNFKDQLQQVDLNGGGTAYYVYDATGQRVRKVWEKSATLIEERIYFGGFEIFRRHGGAIGANTATLERETLHIMDDKKRIALVETRTKGNDGSPEQLIRYQFDNHLGSACLELNDHAEMISYEEYYPYGSTSYQAGRSQVEVSQKRYHYSGKERDEETGFYYYGIRFYISWLGRWISIDPVKKFHESLYAAFGNSPILFIDPTGDDYYIFYTDFQRKTEEGGFPWMPLPNKVIKRPEGEEDRYFYQHDEANLRVLGDVVLDKGKKFVEVWSPYSLRGYDWNLPGVNKDLIPLFEEKMILWQKQLGVPNWSFKRVGSESVVGKLDIAYAEVDPPKINEEELSKVRSITISLSDKSEPEYSTTSLYYFGGKYGNINEAGNYVIGFAFGFSGYSIVPVTTLAQIYTMGEYVGARGSKEIFYRGKERRSDSGSFFDEPHEQKVIRAGVNSGKEERKKLESKSPAPNQNEAPVLNIRRSGARNLSQK